VNQALPHPAPPGARVHHHQQPLSLALGGLLPQVQIAYETWGTLSPAADNAVLLCTGLSASSHARSSEPDPSPGWWEGMIGPGAAIDTDRWFVVCCNVLGGCFGSTGPGSLDPRGRPYAMRFPVVTVWDFVRVHGLMLDALGINRLHAAIGSSLGGMQALAFAAAMPERVARVVAISAPARSYPLSIALRHVQREAVMRDPAWNGGEYYPGPGPHSGLNLARQIGTITYRSGAEWDERFLRERTRPQPLDLGIDFQIESYLTYQGDKFVGVYDPNSYLYISKAMDLFDLAEGAPSLEAGVARISAEALVIGVSSDLLFPLHQQQELARLLFDAHGRCRFFPIESVYGHDAFLIEIEPFAELLRPFLNG
jgi:homoserine O-acetyltransferase